MCRREVYNWELWFRENTETIVSSLVVRKQAVWVATAKVKTCGNQSVAKRLGAKEVVR